MKVVVVEPLGVEREKLNRMAEETLDRMWKSYIMISEKQIPRS